ncbi:MAG: hypothetical protein CMQ20_01705 [Gammaproteobacteria bacterium]|jgi:uncharacterized protein (DUF58 family)|nr:hypothetical protein [Gammaproteobacteria bacterium]|tara:strand:- start:918 stop:2243 length:1326 start_codon:yes stop_codon:yes gene_type:complete
MFRETIFPSYVRITRASQKASRRTSERGKLIQTSAIICAAIGVDTDLTLTYQLFAFLLCLIIVSRLSLRIQPPKISVTRRLPKYATAGQAFEYSINVANEGNHTERDLKLIDNPRIVSPDFKQFQQEREPGEETRNAYDRWIGFHRFVWLQRRNTGIVIKQGNVPEISLKATADAMMEALPLRRGIVNFTSTTLLSPDPFGLNYAIQNFSQHEQLMVLPKRYPVSTNFELPGGRHFQPGGINSTWSIGESEEFVSLRDYRDGDSMRKVHWPSTAKREKPVVREFQDEFFVRQALVLDTNTQDSEILEETISVAASLLLQTETSDGLMDLIYASNKTQIVTAGRGYAHVNHQLEALATLSKYEEATDRLHETLSAHRKLISGCILVLPGWSEAQQKLVKSLSSAGIPVALFILTRDENELTNTPARANILPLTEVAERLASL